MYLNREKQFKSSREFSEDVPYFERLEFTAFEKESRFREKHTCLRMSRGVAISVGRFHALNLRFSGLKVGRILVRFWNPIRDCRSSVWFVPAALNPVPE